MINVKFEQMGLIRVIHATCTCGAEHVVECEEGVVHLLCTCGAEHAVECEEGVALCMEELGGCGAKLK